jgi:hypothetical protein
MATPGWKHLRGRFSLLQLALLAIATALGIAAALYKGLGLWQIAVILIALAAWIWPFGAIVLWIARGYGRTKEASD